ncbi:MAG TPA: tetratricopeptide repeat protein [Verrucomicrobiae bacterium]|nr:tetratricopeptide repeat protein [Verrucomicrobiae bacterium]
MSTLQDQYDEAMFDFSTGKYAEAVERLRAILAEDPGYFDAQLALGMAYYRQGDFTAAIAEGHKAEKLKPHEQLVHTNLSLFYMKAGDKVTAEHHGLQARISSWRADAQQAKSPERAHPGDPELQIAKPKLEPVKIPGKFPDMPWKKKPPAGDSSKH